MKDNRLDLFQRVPSELRLYREYCHQLVERYGSVMDFVMRERLGWTNLTPSGPPFSNPGKYPPVHAAAVSGCSAKPHLSDDYMILFNDWPYGIDTRCVHLVVWTKFPLPPDPTSAIGDVSPETRAMIQSFVDQTFGAKDVIWFLNWASLKSIHSVEHFHVLLLDPDPHFIKRITNGDVPLRDKVKGQKMD